MDCQSRMADFASAFLARDHSTATDFELRIGRARHSVRARPFGVQRTARPTATDFELRIGRARHLGARPDLRRAEDCPPYHIWWSKLVRVRKLPQDRIVPRRPQVFDHPAKDRIQQRIRVHDVQVEGDQFAVQMQLRLIVQRIAVVIF